jgi:hypothetical protein
VAVKVSLLFFMKTDSGFPKGIGNEAKQVFLALAYSGLFLSLSAAACPLILTHMSGKIPAPTPKDLSDGEIPDSSWGYGGRALLTWVRCHCEYPVSTVISLPHRRSQGCSPSSEVPFFQSRSSSYTFGWRSQTLLESPFLPLRCSPRYP